MKIFGKKNSSKDEEARNKIKYRHKEMHIVPNKSRISSVLDGNVYPDIKRYKCKKSEHYAPK